MIPIDQIIQGFIVLAVLEAIWYGLMPMLCGFTAWVLRVVGASR